MSKSTISTLNAHEDAANWQQRAEGAERPFLQLCKRRGVGCYYSWLYGEPGVWTRAFGPLRLTIRSITAS